MISYPENDYRDYIEHSAKGQMWSKHKYLHKINDRYIYPQGTARKKKSTVRLTSSQVGTFRDRLESALYTDLKNSAKKLYESGSSSNVSRRKKPAKRSIFARYFGRKRFGGRTSTRTGRSGTYSSSSRKF